MSKRQPCNPVYALTNARNTRPPTGADRVRRVNMPPAWYRDLYHHALSLHWALFILLGSSVYLGVNVLFALLYLAQPGSIGGAPPGFWNAFFFSIQTIATIGYGQMAPATFYCNVLVTVETMAGLVFLALATGVTFARISRPTARVLFANVATVTRHNGVPTLMFRIGNGRKSQILEASVAVSLLRDEITDEGVALRRFYSLPLLRAHSPAFALSFTIMHPIDDQSPFLGMTPEALAACDAELLVNVTGLEEVSSQTVHARYGYLPEHIRFNERFTDLFSHEGEGWVMDYAKFHDTQPMLSPNDEGS